MRIVPLLLAVLTLALGGAACGAHPVDAAFADAARLAPELRPYARYLRLDEVPQVQRPELLKLLAVHVNQLSLASDLVPPVVVSADQSLVRIVTTDYGEQFATTWERLVSPFDHQLIQAAAVEYGYHDPSTKQWVGVGAKRPIEQYGYRDAAGGWHAIKIEERRMAGERKVALGFWLADTPERAQKLRDLVDLLGNTKVPLVQARWFLTHTAAQADRAPTGYYDFLGVKTEKDFQALANFDPKRSSKRIEFREAVAVSGVTLQPRGIVRRDAEGTSYWYTLDFRKALDRVNPLRVFGDELEKAFRDPVFKAEVATEQYIGLPNDLWAFGLFNQAGEAQESAPDFIASDHRSTSNDHRVHVGISCIRCHVDGGLQPVDGWAKDFFPPPLELKFVELDAARRFRQQYGRNLAAKIEQDRRPYSAAVKQLAGWTTKEYAAAFGKLWQEYEDAGVDLAQAARDLSTTPAKLKAAIVAAIRTNQADPLLSALILDGPRARKLPVRQWEELYPIAQLALRGMAPP